MANTPAAPERADAAAWLAVAAGTLGALMATLDISIVNSSLPTIQGEIGASGTEGTWVATAYLVAEIVIIPLSAWLTRMLGLRTFLLIAVVLFTGFSMICGISTNLTQMIIGRVGQGFTGGALIPTAQTIIAQRLPRSQQPVGIAAFGVTAIMGPVIGPVIGGWLTENVSWHYAFFLNLPIGALLVGLLLIGLPHQKAKLSEFAQADFLGIIGLALGLGGLTVMLEEGQRELWFASSLIRTVAAISAVGFISLFAGQFLARRPVIKLSLLLDRQFGSVALMGVVLGIVLYGTSYVIPQFLASIADYNSLQSGKVVMLSGIPSLMLMAIVPILLRRIDIRIAVGGGLLIMGMSAYFDANLNAFATGGDFTESQLLRGVGQILAMLFLSQAAVQSVPPADAGDASGLFNAMRNLGGSFALAGISIIQDQRTWFHSRRMEETLNANSVMVQDYMAGSAQRAGSMAAAYRQLGGQIQVEALVMTYNDIFFIMACGTLIVLPLVLFLRPLPKHSEPAAMH
ncbi:MDR family MFS transporter [Sphingomonas sp. BAUL-RG-20F-R05-02]|uniref:MDR family MFS transporter n=1 Tax=Sphingomonas sp. BAUL-RG-20F-R05-02 TaxID=2914830 RepID=UPI001F566FAA|nr:MDR family MFS transporter [Sphingomonas sp. BAUL-RG-20F-R05-02]